jgi:hypothetical protein
MNEPTDDADAHLRQLAIELGADYLGPENENLLFEVRNRYNLSREELAEIANTLRDLLSTSPDDGIQAILRKHPSIVLR